MGDNEENNYGRPAILYHYCSPQAFFEIIRGGTIRLGRLSAMNDTAEFTWMRSVVQNVLQRRKVELPSVADPLDRQWLAEWYLAMEEHLASEPDCDPYCVCFSGQGDVLSQWRSYAGNADGFAIGFDSVYLRLGRNDNPRRVEYDEKSHKDSAESLLTIHNLSRHRDHLSPREWADTMNEQLLMLCLASKNPAFVEEQEYRVIHDISERKPVSRSILTSFEMARKAKVDGKLTDEYAMQGSTLRHYLALHYEPSAVKEIVLGPRNPAREDDVVLRRFLTSVGMSRVKLVPSTATLR